MTVLSYFGDVLAFDILFVVQVLALILGIWAIRSVGENNWSVYPVPNEGSTISTLGAYRYVRHPMYLALLLFLRSWHSGRMDHLVGLFMAFYGLRWLLKF